MALSITPAIEIEFDDGIWTDVSAYSRSARGHRGRSSESDKFRAGTAAVVLSNADRRFDPEHAAGPHYGKLLPRKRIRIGFVYAATTYWKFYGFVDGWPQAYDGPNDSTVTVRATDAFKVFARARVPSVWQQTIEADATVTAWYRLGESSGTAAADSSQNKRHGTYEGGATFNARAGLTFGDSDGAIAFDGIDDYVSPPLAAAVDTSAAFAIEFWVEKSEEVGGNDQIIFEQSQGQFTDSDGVVSVLIRGTSSLPGQVNFALISGSSAVMDSGVRVDDGARHHVVATADGVNIARLYVDGVERALEFYTPTTAPVTWLRLGDGRIGSGVTADGFRLTATLDEFVIHDTALSAATVLEHYQIGTAPWAEDTPAGRITRVLDYIDWPVADRDLDEGRAVLLPAGLETNALTHFQDIETTEGGRFFVDKNGKAALIGRSNFLTEAVYATSNATFGDAGAELPYQATSSDLYGYDDDSIINEARVRQFDGSEQMAVDATSVTEYGLVTGSESSLEVRPGVIRNRAEYLVNRFKDPLLRMPRVVIKPESQPADLWPIVGASDVGYRYTFNRRPQSVGSAISKEFHLEGESFAITPGDATFEWELSPAETAWVWGDTWPIRWSY